jgi:cyclic pyranopterin phosphate synthase
MTASHTNGHLIDRLGRPLRSLRISVTDRCNLRCLYCMPEEDYIWLPRESLLTFEEIARLAGIFTELGVEKVRLTGGEPLLRHNLPELVRQLAANRAISEISLTTNGLQLPEQAAALRAAGLHRLNISLDTLQPARFQKISRRDELSLVLDGIGAAHAAGFSGTKLDSVIIRAYNEDELVPLIEFARAWQLEVRFLEYMDVGGATSWTSQQVVSRAEMLDAISTHFGAPQPLGGQGSAPAERFRLPDGTVFGIVASTTTPFCRACDRSRLTADGYWYLCLYGTQGVDLRSALRSGASHDTIKSLIIAAWRARDDRGAEVRRNESSRTAFIPLERLRLDPHLEMHTRGG